MAVAALATLLGVGFATAALTTWPRTPATVAEAAMPPVVGRESARAAAASDEPARPPTAPAPTEPAPASAAPVIPAPVAAAPATAAPATAVPVAPESARPRTPTTCVLALSYVPNRVEPEDSEAIDTLATWLAAAPEVRVVVRAHADGRGSTHHNFQLSERRATWIKTRLERRAVDGTRVTVQAFGEYVPLEGVDREDARNRRTEVVLRGMTSECPLATEEGP